MNDAKESEGSLNSKVVCVSGYFDPFHSGHKEYLEKAKLLGDKLLVIVNNDIQSVLKKGNYFMKDTERVELISALACVDRAVLSIDTDRTVCETLRLYRPDIFANGGDQNNDSIPERPICEELGIKLVDGLGDKKQSSRWLIKKASEAEFKPEWLGVSKEPLLKKYERQWGYYEHLLESLSGYQVKRLVIFPGKATSLQRHQHREEMWTVVEGRGEVFVDNSFVGVEPGNAIYVDKMELHQIRNYDGKENLVIIEVQIGSYLGEDDIERFPSPERSD